jgi:lysophospholipase L1-like esterase
MPDTAEKPPRWKRLLQNCALSAATFLACAGLLELVLRLNGYGNLEIYEPDPALYWRLKPNQNCFTKIDRRPVHVNSRGTRGPEFQVPKPSGTLRILSLGDSRTFGWGLAGSETYSDRLRQLLQERRGGSNNVEVINAGVNAWSFPQMLVYFRETAARYEPDIVILGEANLWTQFSEKASPEFVRKFMSRVRLKNLLRRFAIYHYVIEVKLKSFYERHRTKFIPVDPRTDTLFKDQQQSDPDALFRSAIEETCRLARAGGARPVLLYLPISDELDTTNAPSVLKAKREVSRALNVPLVEMTDDLRAKGKALYLEADSVHLNAEGNELVARRLFETVSRMLAL